MKYNYVLSLIIAVVPAFFACQDEKALAPLENITVNRYEFPQGNNSWDQEIEKIYREYGVRCIYKDFTSKDLNREWTGGGSSVYAGEAVPENEISFYVEFNKEYVFPCIGKEVHFPLYYYFIKNFRYVATDDEEESSIASKFDGFDYWAISFTEEDMENRSRDEMIRVSNGLIYALLKNFFQRGILTEPGHFRDGIDYTTVVWDGFDDDKPELYRRGFVDRVKESFSNGFQIWNLKLLTTDYGDFWGYVRSAMFHPESVFREKYPADAYPLLQKRYDMVVKQVLQQTGIDLKKVAERKLEK